MESKDSLRRRFEARIRGTEKGRAYLVLPFDPEEAWGPKARYHVRGTVNGRQVRGALEQFQEGHFLPMGQACLRGVGLSLGDLVEVVLEPEGPQSGALAPDIAAALAADPEAASFFDGLATFYRKNYLRWIDATKRSPEVRAQRIAELVELMKTGEKQRPR